MEFYLGEGVVLCVIGDEYQIMQNASRGDDRIRQIQGYAPGLRPSNQLGCFAGDLRIDIKNP